MEFCLPALPTLCALGARQDQMAVGGRCQDMTHEYLKVQSQGTAQRQTYIYKLYSLSKQAVEPSKLTQAQSQFLIQLDPVFPATAWLGSLLGRLSPHPSRISGDKEADRQSGD